MKYLLAHDIGTSGDKAALFSADGHLIASKTVSYQTFYAQGGAIEQRPQDWWEAVCQATRAVMAGVDPAQIAAVCFGGMGHCCTCLDEQGNFLAPSLLWSDSRSGQEQAELEAAFGAGIETLELPTSLEEIEAGAFCDRSSLEEIVLPRSVTSMGKRAFPL